MMENARDFESPLMGFITIRIVHDDDDDISRKRKEKEVAEDIKKVARGEKSFDFFSSKWGGKEEPEKGWF